MKLADVHTTDAYVALYELLGERLPSESISHAAMPTFEQHCRFVDSKPYMAWYLIVADFRTEGDEVMGACYLSKNREIGVFVFKKHRGHGLGKWAVRAIMRRHGGRFLANISPNNPDSTRLFEGLGFRHIQNTFCGPSGNPYELSGAST